MLPAFNLSQQIGKRVINGPCITLMMPPIASKTPLWIHRKARCLIRKAERMLIKNYPALATGISLQLQKMMDTVTDQDLTKSIVIMLGEDVKKIYYLDIKVQERIMVADHWCTWCWIQADSSPVKMILLKGSIIYQLPADNFTQPLFAFN